MSFQKVSRKGSDGSIEIPLGVTSSGQFSLTKKQAEDLFQDRKYQDYLRYGGLEGLSKMVNSNTERGLEEEIDDVEEDGAIKSVPYGLRKQYFGKNVLPKAQSKHFLKMVLEALSDKTLIILICASIISIIIGIIESQTNKPSEEEGGEKHLGSWVEGIAIMIAVVVVVLVNSINDWQKERQFQKLYAKNEDKEIKVVRQGEQRQVSIFEVVVGDIVVLDTGDIICADGILIDGHDLKCDESGMTGESDAIKKDGKKDPFILSGTKVIDGVGSMLVLAVGENSFNGKAMLSLRREQEDTPLQVKLGDLAETIGKLGLSVAILMFIILILKYFISEAINDEPFPNAKVVIGKIIEFLISAIIIVVVAVPEGLPMAVTLSLAYATIQMLKDNNLVRVLDSCETMGGATTICSDKTGTLTQNKMSVVKGFVCNEWFGPTEIKSFTGAIRPEVLEKLVHGVALNSTAYEGKDEKGKVTFIGSKTESALLGFATELGADYHQLRKEHHIEKLFPFSSERKRMSTLVKYGNRYVLYTKGASEIVLEFCSTGIDKNGKIYELDQHKKNGVEEAINQFATEALRTIAMAYRVFTMEEYKAHDWSQSPETNLTLMGIVGIQDPLRPEVPKAIEQCKHAGIVVRMVTGDNIVTARNIAKNCGILTKGGIVMEGSEFRRLTIDQMDRIIPNLQVLARSSPTDKQLLVERLKAIGNTVAVTGDGTNDAPALKLADVGFSMGIAGTEVAKEASDIILMDDNFASIVRAVVWGRSVYDSVRKFLQFQLTVNVTAVTLAFISAVFDGRGESVLTAVQLLWVNLIMDTMAALALATEPPTDILLERKPHRKTDSLISFQMWKMVIGQSIFQVGVNLFLLYYGTTLFSLSGNENERIISRTIVFNTFVFMQVFNELNCRRIGNDIKIFSRLHKHKSFVAIFLITVVVQFIVTQYGSLAFRTYPLNWQQWLACIGIAFISIPIALVLRLIPDCVKPQEEVVNVSSVTREKLLWENAIDDVRTQIRVVKAIRHTRN